MKKLLKYLGWTILLILLLANVGLLLTGNTHLYKGIWNTYLKGRKGVTIDQSDIFENRQILAKQGRNWSQHPLYNTTVIPAHQQLMLDTLQTEALVVIKNGQLLHEAYRGDMGKTRIINGFSMAKSVVAILTAKSVETGTIRLNDPVSSYVNWPQLQPDDDTLRIWHLAGMCSGIDYEEAYTRSAAFAFTSKAYFGNDLEATLKQYQKSSSAGGIIDYQSGNTQLLGLILTKANGKSLAEMAENWIWNPLNATVDATWSLDHEDGLEKAFCCIQSVATDWARIGQMMLQNGQWNGKTVLDSSLVKQLVGPSPCQSESDFSKYGLGWWRYQDARGDLFYARGILGQYLICAPAKNIVLVRLGHLRGEKLPNDHPVDFVELVDMIYNVF